MFELQSSITYIKIVHISNDNFSKNENYDSLNNNQFLL